MIYEVADWRTTIGDVRRDLQEFIWEVSDRIRNYLGRAKPQRESENELDAPESGPKSKANPDGKPPPPRSSDK